MTISQGKRKSTYSNPKMTQIQVYQRSESIYCNDAPEDKKNTLQMKRYDFSAYKL